MNSKSTENLIDSGGSIEELFVPPLDLKGKIPLKKVNSDQVNSESDRPSGNSRKRVDNNFLVDKSSLNGSESKPSIPPIPAARKFSLPPIASKRNGKQLKENSNELTRRQSSQSSDTIQIINERPNPQLNEKDNSESESDSNIRQTNSKKHNKRNEIELTTLTNQTKKHLKKQFNSAEVNEETTSFISYEEKHEKEDNSEHLVSQHSSTKSREFPDDDAEGVHNKAFVEDTDDEIGVKLPSKIETASKDIEESITTKSKKKEKRSKSAKKSKEKRRKRESRNGEQATEQIEATEQEEAAQDSYDFKKVIGVWIHETSALRFDRLIRQPRVRVSFYNLSDGELLNKSNPLRNAVLNYEPTNVTFIQPILTNRCTFKESSQIECNWNNELLIINEDIRHIQKYHIIIFFEIVDILSSNRNIEPNAGNGWYPICWAFLRPGDGKTFSNIDVRCSLQLHYYQRQRPKHGIIDEWKAQRRIKYPAYLSVTVGAYQPETTRSVSLTRPMSVLEEEITGDIYTYASDDDEPIDEQCQAVNSTTEHAAQVSREHLGRVEPKSLNLESRLPGQQCKCPNRLVYKHDVSGHLRHTGSHSQYGSMVSKFSSNGSLLAFHCTAYMRSNHEIVIVNVNNLQVWHTLVGHLSIVYDLDWLNENTLVSVSSDRTAIIWFLIENRFKMKVLPHPSFVYAVKWLSNSTEHAYIATGGRDCVLRIWKICIDVEADFELCDELIQHDNYITSLATSRKSTKIYSADWNGVLLEWSLKKSKGKDTGPLYSLRRKIKIFPKSIARIELHAKSNRLYVQCINDALVYAIETTSAVVIQTIKCSDESPIIFETRNTFTVSPCGSLIFTKHPTEDQITCARTTNDEQIGQFRIPVSLTTRKYVVTSLSYHPTKNVIACSIFGDMISSCLFLMCNESDIKKKDDCVNRYEDDLERDFQTLDEWQKNRSHELTSTADGIKSIAIDSILNRIDDLFFMAIRSPAHANDNDNDQFKEMQQFLEKLRIEHIETEDSQNITQYPNARDESTHKIETFLNELSSIAGDSNGINLKSNTPLTKPRASWQLQSTTNIPTKSDASNSSTQSHHTFCIDQPSRSNQQTKKSDENELSNATYSIPSDNSNHSNLTFEIPSTAKSQNATK